MMQNNINYQRVAEAIDYLSENFKNQPNLDEVAQRVHVSPTHFQRIFTDWAGVSPKKFMQYLSLEHLRTRIYDAPNLHQAADLVGLSSQSRVYDLFVNIEGVTPHEYKTFGKGLDIQYGFHETPFGECLIATTEKGICTLSFIDESNKKQEFDRFTDKWQLAKRTLNPKNTEGPVQQIFDGKTTDKIHLLAQGTNFQLKVWEALLRMAR
jgi:AraC family transcriptional regulator, regulatory protein of adaptative response / methylated-DNA-[protein]-cysteine methyltransferase